MAGKTWILTSIHIPSISRSILFSASRLRDGIMVNIDIVYRYFQLPWPLSDRETLYVACMSLDEDMYFIQ